MFKTVTNRVWAFDAEWIPDPQAGRVLYKLPPDTADKAVMEEMWKRGGAKDDDPYPYLKTVLCRIVSVSAVERIFHASPEGRPYREIAEIRVRVVPRTRAEAPMKLADKAKEIGADAIILVGDEQIGTFMVSGPIGDAKAIAIKFGNK